MNEAMAKNLKDYRTALSRIRANRDLSEEARQRMAGEVYSAVVEEHRRIVGEGRQGAEKAYNAAAKSVFGATYPANASAGDKAAISASHRDAMFRVSQIGREDSDELHRIQSMAAATGDKLLQRAVLYHAHQRGDQSLVEAVCDSNPDLERGWDGLMERAQEMNAQSDPLASSMYAPPKPEDVPTAAPDAEAG